MGAVHLAALMPVAQVGTTKGGQCELARGRPGRGADGRQGSWGLQEAAVAAAGGRGSGICGCWVGGRGTKTMGTTEMAS